MTLESRILAAVNRLAKKHGGLVPIPLVRKALRGVSSWDVTATLVALDREGKIALKTANYDSGPRAPADLREGIRLGERWYYYFAGAVWTEPVRDRARRDCYGLHFHSRDVILTDRRGRPIERPRRADFASTEEYLRAFWAYKDAITRESQHGISRGVREGLRDRRRPRRARLSRADQSRVSAKIRILREEGYGPKQAAAIAYNMLRRGQI